VEHFYNSALITSTAEAFYSKSEVLSFNLNNLGATKTATINFTEKISTCKEK